MGLSNAEALLDVSHNARILLLKLVLSKRSYSEGQNQAS